MEAFTVAFTQGFNFSLTVAGWIVGFFLIVTVVSVLSTGIALTVKMLRSKRQ